MFFSFCTIIIIYNWLLSNWNHICQPNCTHYTHIHCNSNSVYNMHVFNVSQLLSRATCVLATWYIVEKWLYDDTVCKCFGSIFASLYIRIRGLYEWLMCVINIITYHHIHVCVNARCSQMIIPVDSTIVPPPPSLVLVLLLLLFQGLATNYNLNFYVLCRFLKPVNIFNGSNIVHGSWDYYSYLK